MSSREVIHFSLKNTIIITQDIKRYCLHNILIRMFSIFPIFNDQLKFCIWFRCTLKMKKRFFFPCRILRILEFDIRDIKISFSQHFCILRSVRITAIHDICMFSDSKISQSIKTKISYSICLCGIVFRSIECKIDFSLWRSISNYCIFPLKLSTKMVKIMHPDGKVGK